jgi:Peptidase family C25
MLSQALNNCSWLGESLFKPAPLKSAGVIRYWILILVGPAGVLADRRSIEVSCKARAKLVKKIVLHCKFLVRFTHQRITSLLGSLARKPSMKTRRSTLRKRGTVKLSVTVKCHLERKYDAAAIKKINAAIARWKEKDANRGIRTVHVAVDDPAAMKMLGATPVSGKATAPKIKRAIDDLCKQHKPEYLVLFGGHDIVPMFEVLNPAYDQNGDEDEKVWTDNPYASSLPFRSSNRRSYLVPDRVTGRIPDMMSESDPAWFVDYLKTATSWESQPKGFYTRSSYAICSRECKGAGLQCMRFIDRSDRDLLISPPTTDSSTSTRNRLSARVHLIKCHGNPLDANFWGEGKRFVKAISSANLKAHLKPNTVVGTMCCYGAQIFPPSDPDAWPLASTYLRKGALGFIGSTMKAWVGFPSDMMWADYIAGGYLKYVLRGFSIGLAFLDSKMNYAAAIIQKGNILDLGDEKTLIEYVLLGDPSIHPVTSEHPSALAAEERRQRRVVRQRLANGLRTLLPERRPVPTAKSGMAKKVFNRAHSTLGKGVIKELTKFRIKPAAARVEKLDTSLDAPGGSRQSLEYYWSGRRDRDGQKQICVLKAETDLEGNLCRTAVLHSS